MKKKRALFLCTHNSCRSQMAEGLVNHDLGDRIEAFSAGTEMTRVNPLAAKVMAELGVDLAKHRSKILDEFAGQTFDYVITLCGDANEKCPLFFGGVQRQHMGFEDPSRLPGSEEEVLPEYRRVRDEIRRQLQDFFTRELAEIQPLAQTEEEKMKKNELTGISFFERNLTLWVILCMVVGVLIGKFLPAIPATLAQFEYAQVSIPIAVLIWLMIYPMMMKVDFASIRNVGRSPTGLYLTWVVNWLIKPFTMFGIAALFFYVIFKALIPPDLARDYLAGAVLLGAAPCTAMVFVWSHLTRGNPAYTVVQVATNDLIILLAFTPIVALLLGVGGIAIPWNTLLLSVFLFVVIPLTGGIVTRTLVIKNKGAEYFHKSFTPKFNNVTIGGLLLTLILIFSFQGDVILGNPLHIVLIAIPLTIQTFFIFFIAYLGARELKLSHDIAAPAGMIGASNFFELAVAVAITLFGASSPAVLVTIVGVLVEVPLMLFLVKIANRTTGWFPAKPGAQAV
jgi:arsenite transporter